MLVDESDVCVRAQTPRLLIIEIRKGGLKCVFFSAHIPHGGRAREREQFLRDLQRQLHQIGQADVIIGGVDANGRPPCQQHPVTGTLECGTSDPEGEQFVESMRAGGLWLPSTDEELHTRQSETFCHANGQRHRIDFLSVGGSAKIWQAASWVDLSIDMAANRDDHFAASLALTGQAAGGAAVRRLWRPRYDRDKMDTAAGREILKTAFAEYQPPPWWVHVDLHCQHLQDYLHGVLVEHFTPPTRARTTYIPDEVWKWREHKMSLKRSTGPRKLLWRKPVEMAFRQWSTGATGLVENALCKNSLLYQLTASAIGFITARIKQAIHKGKTDYLRTMIQDGPQSATNILQRARRHGVGGRKLTCGQRPLPLLIDDKGDQARCQDDHDRIWLQHFSEQEYGRIMDPSEFLSQAQPPRFARTHLDVEVFRLVFAGCLHSETCD